MAAQKGRQGSRGFVDGGTVKKFIPPAPLVDRPALGPNAVVNQNEATYFGTKSGLDAASRVTNKRPGKQPSAPMPGGGGSDAIASPISDGNPQEVDSEG